MTNRIDRQTAKEISQKINDFVNSLEAEYGVKAGRRSATFSDTNVKVSIDCVLTPENREEGLLTPAEEMYDANAVVHGLPARGSVFKDAYGDAWKVIEWIPRGRKYKIIMMKVSDGKKYKYSVNQLKQLVDFQ